jgi:hypothetical protein
MPAFSPRWRIFYARCWARKLERGIGASRRSWPRDPSFNAESEKGALRTSARPKK